jgi:O-antigen/teichoic acid export membrane protein
MITRQHDAAALAGQTKPPRSHEGSTGYIMRVIRSGALVFGANIADTTAVLLRNVVLARLLTVQDFGIAATFSIMMTLMDAAQNAGISRMIVQAPDAESTALQDGLHGVQFVLGLLTALLLALLSWPYALAMGTPEIVWAYALIALVPLLRGIGHLDPYRLQRQGRFGPAVTRQLVPQLASLLAIWPAYMWLHDYRVMLVVIFVQQVAVVLASHLGAKRLFRLSFDREIVARAFHFGWPLLLNGVLMFFVFNGDRMVVSHHFGLQTLGWFSAAVTMTLTPTLLVARSLQTLVLPSMARAQNDPTKLQRLNDQLVSMVMIIYVGFVAGIALFGEPVMSLVFGEKFRPAGPFLLLLAVMQGIRLVRAVPAITAMARAETKNPLYTNIIRGLFIPVALLVALITGDIYWMLATGIAGEAVAALASAWLARQMVGILARHFMIGFTAASLCVGAIVAIKLLDLPLWLMVPAVLPLIISARDFILHARELVGR